MKRAMKFMAPDGGEGGGTAVLEPMTPVGELYTAALEKAQGKEPAEAPEPTATGPAATGATATPAEDKTKATSATGPVTPVSALDAALEGATGAAPTEAPTEDFLKDLPETLPREGRKDHWEKARGAISKLGTTVAERDKRIAELTREVDTARTAPAGSNEQIATLQKQLDEYKDAVVAINVEYDPAHREKFITGRIDLVSKAAAKAHAFGGNGEKIKEAMSQPEGRGRSAAIKEALETVEEEYDRARVMDLIKDVAKLDDEKEALMKDPQGAWAKLQESEKARSAEAIKKAEEYKTTVFETVSKKLPETLFLLREVDPSLPGAAEHNQNAKAMRESAFKLLGPDAKPEELVEAAFWKQAGPKIQELFMGSRKELNTALAALKKYETAEPGFRGGKGPVKTGPEAKLDKSPGTLYRETMARLAGGEE